MRPGSAGLGLVCGDGVGAHEQLACPGDAGADRADRALADHGRLCIGEAVQLGEHERRAPREVELAERLLHLGPGTELGAVGRGRLEREALPLLPPAPAPPGGPAGDLEQPGSGRTLPAEGGKGSPQPDVGLLGGVVGLVTAGDAGAETPDLGVGGTHEAGEGRPVASPRLGKEDLELAVHDRAG